MNKIGIQWQRETDAVLDYNRLVQPTVLKSVNCRTKEFWQQLVGDNPNAIRIYRHFPNWDCWQDNPEQCAIDAVNDLKAEMGHITDLITHVEDNNEYIHSFMHDKADAADRYMSAFIGAAWNRLGLRTVFLNSACGHWGDDVTVFHRTLEAAETYSAILGQHEYDWPTMDRIYKETGDYWLCGKWKKSMAAIKAAGYEGIKVIITEAGIDGGVADKPMRGWRSVPNALENYCSSLLWYNDLLINDNDVLGVALFGISMEGDWGDFDIENSEVPNRIAQFPTVPIPEPPEPPNDGGEPMIRIYDFNNSPFEPDATTRDWPWLRSIFGDIQIRPIEEKPGIALQPGNIIYKIKWLDCRVGDSNCVIHVEGVDGNSEQGKQPVFGWSTAEPHGLPDIWGNWTDNGVVGPTNENGDVGPGMGTGAYYDAETERGPHFIWVWDRPSDYIDGIGMLTWHPDVEGNHLHVNIGYQAVVYQGEEPEPPTDGELLDVAKQIYGEVKETRLLVAEIRDFLKDWEFPEPPEDPDEPEPPKAYFGQYFNNRNLEGTPTVERWDDAVFFSWGSGPPAPGIGSDDFSVRWTATRHFEAGLWRFHVKVDDGVRLYVDGNLLIDKWIPQAPTEYTAVAELSRGGHDIKMEYYERGGGATAQMWYVKM